MIVGLYFGSFNPIHTGHCIIGSYMLNETEIEEVWFVVSPQNPFKTSKTLLGEYDRLNLVQQAIGQHSGLRASNIEFHLEKPSYTSVTLISLVEKYPQHSFVIIMGSDSYQNLHKWKNARFIIDNFRIYIYMRPGFNIDNQLSVNIRIIKAPLLEISATQIRQYVKEKKSIRFLVPETVREEIEKNGYYR